MCGAVFIRGRRLLEDCSGFLVLSYGKVGLAQAPARLGEAGTNLKRPLQQRYRLFGLVPIHINAAQIGIGICVERIDLQLLLKLGRRFLEPKALQVDPPDAKVQTGQVRPYFERGAKLRDRLFILPLGLVSFRR